MSLAERVTITMPAPLREAASQMAEGDGVSFSAFVSSAVEDWIRTRLLDDWLDEYAAEQGGWDETRLAAVAAEAGLAYLPPGRPGRRAEG
jgi:hypothetical protein